ncbi:hypothetical protein EB231_35010 [Mesorhizobium sp. NZP2298]|nr:hypothetical protein EB231_35010 [Mesorhizobium sp. NZP2298]
MTRFHDTMQCYVRSVAYDFYTGVGTVFMEEDSCTDMSGCIDVFERMDSKVRRIETYAGARQDTTYIKVNCEWIAS